MRWYVWNDSASQGKTLIRFIKIANKQIRTFLECYKLVKKDSLYVNVMDLSRWYWSKWTRKWCGVKWVEDLDAETMGRLDSEILGLLCASEGLDHKERKQCVLGFTSVPTGEFSGVSEPLLCLLRLKKGMAKTQVKQVHPTCFTS